MVTRLLCEQSGKKNTICILFTMWWVRSQFVHGELTNHVRNRALWFLHRMSEKYDGFGVTDLSDVFCPHSQTQNLVSRSVVVIASYVSNSFRNWYFNTLLLVLHSTQSTNCFQLVLNSNVRAVTKSINFTISLFLQISWLAKTKWKNLIQNCLRHFHTVLSFLSHPVVLSSSYNFCVIYFLFIFTSFIPNCMSIVF